MCEHRTECTELLCMWGSYGKGCKFSGYGRLVFERFLKSWLEETAKVECGKGVVSRGRCLLG